MISIGVLVESINARSGAGRCFDGLADRPCAVTDPWNPELYWSALTLARGTKIGPYEVLSPIGAGGMGEVYRARDPRIGRDVAIKVLPSGFAEDSERLHRFERETRAAGALNHPNILAIYDAGTDLGVPYLVSELLEGTTLQEALGGASIPQRKAIDYALQIARGLAAAHEKGIVHRDLKPANLFVTRDGGVKILDFGLARIARPGSQAEDLTHEPTVTRETETGVVLGTPVYMSPEQVQGRDADHRSDIFALGAVLYEMLAGKRPFAGATTIEVMSSILKEQPRPVSEINPSVSPALESIVLRCLEKDPYDRFQSARDLGFALQAVSGGTPSSASTAIPQDRARRLPHWSLALAGVAAAAAILLAIEFRRGARRERPVVAMINPPANLQLNVLFGGIALSPDGLRIAFTTESEGDRLWVRQLDSGEEHPVEGTSKAYAPFWSPDSKSIGFFNESKLKKVDVSGGPAQTICDAPYGRGGTWSPNGTILFAPRVYSELFRVSADGGEPSRVTRLNPNERTHRWPYFLPDGKHFLYVASVKGERTINSVFLSSLDSPQSRLLVPNALNAIYAPAGYLIFAREGNLLAQPFDVDRLETTGPPFAAAREKVNSNPLGAVAPISVSGNGILAYQPYPAVSMQLQGMSRTGVKTGAPAEIGFTDMLRLSPDGKRVAFVRSTPQRDEPDIWILDTGDRKFERFTFDSYLEQNPTWSPDGKSIVYGSDRTGGCDLYRKALGDGSKEELLLHSDHVKYPDDWSPDGRFILFEEKDPDKEFDLWVLPLFGDRKPFVYLQTPYRELEGHFSPDGRLVAYISDESGRFEIYVRPFPGPGNPLRVSQSGGTGPIWGRDGKELFYISGDRALMAAEVQAVKELRLGSLRPVFRLPDEWYLTSTQFSTDAPAHDVSSDGQTFYFAVPAARMPVLPISLVLNWSAGPR
jgi:serine/threonine protein kinase/Tol biopolymer transport system component